MGLKELLEKVDRPHAAKIAAAAAKIESNDADDKLDGINQLNQLISPPAATATAAVADAATVTTADTDTAADTAAAADNAADIADTAADTAADVADAVADTVAVTDNTAADTAADTAAGTDTAATDTTATTSASDSSAPGESSPDSTEKAIQDALDSILSRRSLFQGLAKLLHKSNDGTPLLTNTLKFIDRVFHLVVVADKSEDKLPSFMFVLSLARCQIDKAILRIIWSRYTSLLDLELAVRIFRRIAADPSGFCRESMVESGALGALATVATATGSERGLKVPIGVREEAFTAAELFITGSDLSDVDAYQALQIFKDGVLKSKTGFVSSNEILAQSLSGLGRIAYAGHQDMVFDVPELVPRIVELVSFGLSSNSTGEVKDSELNVSFNATYAVNGLAMGTTAQVEKILELNVLAQLTNQLNNGGVLGRSQAAKALGCIASDSAPICDKLIKQGVVELLIETTKLHRPAEKKLTEEEEEAEWEDEDGDDNDNDNDNEEEEGGDSSDKKENTTTADTTAADESTKDAANIDEGKEDAADADADANKEEEEEEDTGADTDANEAAEPVPDDGDEEWEDEDEEDDPDYHDAEDGTANDGDDDDDDEFDDAEDDDDAEESTPEQIAKFAPVRCSALKALHYIIIREGTCLTISQRRRILAIHTAAVKREVPELPIAFGIDGIGAALAHETNADSRFTRAVLKSEVLVNILRHLASDSDPISTSASAFFAKTTETKSLDLLNKYLDYGLPSKLIKLYRDPTYISVSKNCASALLNILKSPLPRDQVYEIFLVDGGVYEQLAEEIKLKKFIGQEHIYHEALDVILAVLAEMTDSTSDDEEEEEDTGDADEDEKEAAEEEESKDDKAAAEDADQEDKDVDADTEADADDDTENAGDEAWEDEDENGDASADDADDDNKTDEAVEDSAAADGKVDKEEAEEEEQDEDDEDDEDDEESTRIAIKITRLAASVFITVASSFTDGECLVKARSILTKLFESELEDSFSPEDVTTAADTIKSKDSSESNKRLIIIFLCNLLKSESSAIDDEEATKTALRTTVIPILNIFNGDSDNLLFITSVIAFIDLLSQIWSDFGSAFVRAGFIETVVNALDCDDAEDISGVRRNSVEAELVGNCVSALDTIAMKVYLPTARNEAILEAVLPFTTEPLNTQVSGRIFGYSARLRASAIREDLNDDDDDDGDDDNDDDGNDDNEVSSSTLSAFPDSTLKRLMDMTFAKEEDAEEDPDDSPPTPRALRLLLLNLLCSSSQLVKRFIELGLVERLHTHIKTLIGDIPLPTASDEKAADKPEYDGSVWDSFDIELFKMYLSMLRPLLSCTPELFDKVASTGVLDTLSSITIGNKLDASVDIADNHSEASLTANRTLLYAIFSPKPRTKEQLESVINKYDVLNIATRLLLICGEDASYASENHHHFMLVLTNLHSIFETSSEFVSRFDASVVASVKFLQTYSHMHGRIIEKITGAVDLLKLLRDTEDTLAFSACHALLAQFYGEKTGDDDFVPVKIGLMVLHTKINTGKRVRDPNTPKYNI